MEVRQVWLEFFEVGKLCINWKPEAGNLKQTSRELPEQNLRTGDCMLRTVAKPAPPCCHSKLSTHYEDKENKVAVVRL